MFFFLCDFLYYSGEEGQMFCFFVQILFGKQRRNNCSDLELLSFLTENEPELKEEMHKGEN